MEPFWLSHNNPRPSPATRKSHEPPLLFTIHFGLHPNTREFKQMIPKDQH